MAAWVAAGAVALLVALVVTAAVMLREQGLKSRITGVLSERLHGRVTLDSLDVGFLPHISITGGGLTVTPDDRAGGPPLLTIARFELTPGIVEVLTGHLRRVQVSGLRLTIEPHPTEPGGAPSRPLQQMGFVIDQVDATQVELVFTPTKANHPPLVFDIHTLALDHVGAGKAMPFTVALTNPVPTGLVNATGRFGPWNPDAPDETPVAGAYVFSDANLDTINGLGGTLHSTGRFSGTLGAIEADGTSHTPDFSLNFGAAPLPLDATFTVVVDGTDGTTVLKRVEAALGRSTIVVSGAIANLPGPGNHDVRLEAAVKQGYLEDLLRLASDQPKALMTGRVDATTSIDLPPGPGKVPDRISVRGHFTLAEAHFTAAAVQKKLADLSRHARGKPNATAANVATNVSGEFAFAHQTLQLKDVTFAVPGAVVLIAGRYATDSGRLDFRGTLHMQATLSEATTGWKSFLLRLFDPAFEKHGKGSYVPIKITGTREHPNIGVDFGKILR